MLSLPLKRTDSVKFRKSCESYIRKHYDKLTLEKVLPFLSDLDTAREPLSRGHPAHGEDLSSALSQHALYYRYLCAVENRVSLSGIKLKFTWYDTLSKSKQVESSYLLEKVSVLYNIAALYSRMGANSNLAAEDGSKLALNYFQMAAGCIEEVRKQGFDSSLARILDVSPEHLTFIVHVMLAQAYFSMYSKLDKATTNKLNLARLAITVSRQYGRAEELSSSALLMRAVPDEMRNIVKFQSLTFAATSRYWKSFVDREEGSRTGAGFGIGVSRLRSAYELVQKAMALRGIRGSYLDQGRALLQLVKSEKEESERQNLSIYMESIAQADTLTEVEELTMVQPKFPPLVDLFSPVSGTECLQALVPPEVLALITEYKEHTHQLVFQESERVQNTLHQTHQALGSMNLPHKLDSLVAEKGLPEGAWRKIQEIQGKGGCSQLEQSLASIKSIGENNSRFLSEQLTMLEREEQEDSSYRANYGNRWSRTTSSTANDHVKRELLVFSQKLEQAKQIDAASIRNWETHQDVLGLLKKTKQQLDGALPSEEASGLDQQPAALKLRQALDVVDQLERRLKEDLSKLVQDAEHEDITEQVIELESAKLPRNTLFQNELAKFNSQVEGLFNLAGQMNGAVQAVQVTNAQFEHENNRTQLNQGRMNFLASLEEAARVYNELASHLQQGQQFHTNLSRHLSMLQQKVSDFVFSRNLEKDDLLNTLASAGNPYGGGNPYGDGNPYGGGGNLYGDLGGPPPPYNYQPYQRK